VNIFVMVVMCVFGAVWHYHCLCFIHKLYITVILSDVLVFWLIY